MTPEPWEDLQYFDHQSEPQAAAPTGAPVRRLEENLAELERLEPAERCRRLEARLRRVEHRLGFVPPVQVAEPAPAPAPEPAPAPAADRSLWAQMEAAYGLAINHPATSSRYAAEIDAVADWLEDDGYCNAAERLRFLARRAREEA